MDFYSNEWSKPFKHIFEDEFWGKFNQYFNGAGNQPKANIYESGNELICTFFLPGIKSVEDIRLNVYESVLEVSGVINLEYNGFRLIHEEQQQGSFKRTLELPFPVRKDKVEASYKRGLLAVHLFRLIPNKSTQAISIIDEE
ncbi:Hsp20/alpha crystallin family protein [Halalkalibacter alkalisediminis]|uniref:Hsp20/alpha crystallin family protein n=1 Tax=Halalkalibacter alkalisediminis TaxID=935616 RepID=UPI002361236E|nr:Hsp20/alpha crystallin family protein [Halalkalibacter alkalisediminis]